MDIIFKKLDLHFCKSNYPALYEAINRIEGLTDLQKQRVASLGLEIALLIDGSSIEIFQDDLDYSIEKL